METKPQLCRRPPYLLSKHIVPPPRHTWSAVSGSKSRAPSTAYDTLDQSNAYAFEIATFILSWALLQVRVSGSGRVAALCHCKQPVRLALVELATSSSMTVGSSVPTRDVECRYGDHFLYVRDIYRRRSALELRIRFWIAFPRHFLCGVANFSDSHVGHLKLSHKPNR